MLRMKHRKTKQQRKEDTIRIRVTGEQKRTLIERAQREGLEVSAWLRSLGLREASVPSLSSHFRGVSPSA